MEDMAHRPHMRRNRVRQAAEECAVNPLVRQELTLLQFSETFTDLFLAGLYRITIGVVEVAALARQEWVRMEVMA